MENPSGLRLSLRCLDRNERSSSGRHAVDGRPHWVIAVRCASRYSHDELVQPRTARRRACIENIFGSQSDIADRDAHLPSNTGEAVVISERNHRDFTRLKWRIGWSKARCKQTYKLARSRRRRAGKDCRVAYNVGAPAMERSQRCVAFPISEGCSSRLL